MKKVSLKYERQSVTKDKRQTVSLPLELISFTTNDRAITGTDGSMEYVPWSAICKDYQLASNGVKYPTKFQAVWNYPDGDFVYFDGSISEISYGYK